MVFEELGMIAKDFQKPEQGFIPPEDMGVLDFSGTDYEQCWVLVNLSVPLEVFYQLQALWEREDGAKDAFDLFVGKCLVDWNMPGKCARLILASWLQAIQDPSGPLDSQGAESG